LSSIPVLKYLFGSKDKSITNDDMVFVLIPHIVRSQEIKADNLRPVDTGSGQMNINLYHVTPSAPVHQAPAPVRPAPRPVAGVVVNSPSAEAAAPMALLQMRQDAEAQPATTAPPATAQSQATAAPSLSFTLATPPNEQLKAGSTFQVPILLNGGANLASVPLQLQYDAGKLSLTNVAAGNLLNRDGLAVALVHRDDGPGNLTVVASRPPGAAGINGSGVVCVLTFQAKAAGSTALTLSRAGIIDAAQQPLQAASTHLSLTLK